MILTLMATAAAEHWYVVRVFVKQPGAWKLASMQATIAAPPPVTPAAIK